MCRASARGDGATMTTDGRDEVAASDAATVAVVFCTRDRPDALTQTLDSVWRQTRLPDELIIIDDGALATSVCDAIIAECDSRGVKCLIESNAGRGLTRARNLAADLAASDILQYLDDDVTCDLEFLAEVCRVFRDPAVDVVTAVVDEPAFSGRSARAYRFGYRLACWWRVAPRGRPSAPRPTVLDEPGAARVVRWLSGAAMALRRDVVRRVRFDEGLAEYALGEDREMGYRLWPRHWLVEARRARVVHRRDGGGRMAARRLGYMTSYNYLYILEKTCRLGVGDWFLVAWGLSVLGAMHAAWAVAGDRRAHLGEWVGMLEGVGRWFFGSSAGATQAMPVIEGAPDENELRSLVIRCPLSVPDSRVSVSDSQSAGSSGERGSLPCGRGSDRGDGRSGGGLAKRVLFVTNRLEAGGAELMLVSLVERLGRHGIRPVILCLKDAGPLAERCRAAGVEVHENLLRFKADVAVLVRMRRLIATYDASAIVAAHSGGDRMFWTTLAGRMTRTPVVVWSHWFPEAGSRHFERANRLVARWVDMFVALSASHRAALTRFEHVPSDRIKVIPNGIDVAAFAKAGARASARRLLGLEDHHFAVGIVANLRTEKRHDVFVDAAKRLERLDDNYRFVIIGDGPNRDAVRAAVEASGLDAETLRLLGGRDDVADLLAGLDASCLCSEVECFSVSMLEAAAAGCPFIGPAAGGLAAFLEDRRTGLVIRPADAASLADAVSVLAGDAALRDRLVAAARETVAARFDVETMVRSFGELFTGGGVLFPVS